MARQVLVLQLIVVLVLVVTALALATYDARNDIRAGARDEAVSVARAVARSPVVREAIGDRATRPRCSSRTPRRCASTPASTSSW